MSLFLVAFAGSVAGIGFVLYVAFGGLRGPGLKLSKSWLVPCDEKEISLEEERRATRTFSFTSFGIQKKPEGSPPQTGGIWKQLGWSAWGIRKYPKTTKLGNKCDAALTANTHVFLNDLEDEWVILEIFCLPRYPDLPQAILLKRIAHPNEFILSFSGFKFPICWPFPGVRTGLPLSLLKLAADNFSQVRKACSHSTAFPGEEGVQVNRVAMHYLKLLEMNNMTERVEELVINGEQQSSYNNASPSKKMRLLITGHSMGGSMAQVYALMLAKRMEQASNHVVICCSAHGPMRTGNTQFYNRLGSLGVESKVFVYSARTKSSCKDMIVDEIPFAPSFDEKNFCDAPKTYITSIIRDPPATTSSSTVSTTFSVFRLKPTAPCLDAINTALTAPIPSFPKNHVAGLYEDFFVKIHEQSKQLN